MSWAVAIPVLAALAAVSISVYARTRPGDPASLHRMAEPRPPGDWPLRGGFHAVRTVPDGPAALERLAGVIAATPRTSRLAGSPGERHQSFVTRSRVMGFPDITNVWLAEGHLHVRGHLVIGASDLGVNEKRIRNWLEGARIR